MSQGGGGYSLLKVPFSALIDFKARDFQLVSISYRIQKYLIIVILWQQTCGRVLHAREPALYNLWGNFRQKYHKNALKIYKIG